MRTDDSSTPRPATALRGLLAIVLLGLAALTGATPADAVTKPAVNLSLGQVATLQDSLPPVPGYGPSRRAEAAPTPENCRDGGTASVYCHLYKVNLSVDDDVRARGGFLLTASLEWNRGQEVVNAPNFGSLGQNQIILRIYEEPKYRDPETNAETFTAASGLNSDSPTVLGVVDPAKPFYWVLVANYLGADNRYKLTLRLEDLVGGGPPTDLSAEEDLPPVFDGSATAATPATPDPTPVQVPVRPAAIELAGPAAQPTISGTPAEPALPNLPGLGAPDFALDGVGGSALGEDDLQEITLARGPRPIPPAGDPNLLLLILSLLVLPVGVIGLPLLFLWRRRREEPVPALA